VILVFLYSCQMLAALYHMHDCGVLHADIKPDNILVNARHNAVKVRLQFVQGSV
jgi:serine/threonine-protein kinase PRP4